MHTLPPSSRRHKTGRGSSTQQQLCASVLVRAAQRTGCSRGARDCQRVHACAASQQRQLSRQGAQGAQEFHVLQSWAAQAPRKSLQTGTGSVLSRVMPAKKCRPPMLSSWTRLNCYAHFLCTFPALHLAQVPSRLRRTAQQGQPPHYWDPCSQPCCCCMERREVRDPGAVYCRLLPHD